MNKQESGYRWIVFGIILFVYFVVLCQRTAPGLITDQLMKEFQVSASIIGLVSSVQFLAYSGLQVPVGLIADRFGPIRLLIIGTFIIGIGDLLFILAPNEYVLIFSRFLTGVGDATIFVNFVLILNQWFKVQEYIGLLGIISLTASLGSLTATFPLSMWISSSGWRMPFLSIGIILVVSTYLLYTVLVSKPKQIFKEDSKAGNRSYTGRESVWSILRRILATRQAWAAFFCHFGIVGTYVGFIGSWGVPYGIDVFDLSRSQASQLMMYGLIGAIIGAPLMSWITSRLGAIKIIYTLIQFTVLISWFTLFLSGVKPPFVAVIVSLFIIGFGMGASSLTFAVVRKSFPTEEVGVASGFANMGGFLSAVLLPSLFGSVLDLFPKHIINVGYHYGLIIAVVFSLMGLIGVIMFKEDASAASYH